MCFTVVAVTRFKIKKITFLENSTVKLPFVPGQVKRVYTY